ncbi:RNA polymerase sigma factor [Haliangium ochraceum]|uniref:RNA polymerase, sigma-24 subunit, ECF subfamily n=1 Tax=Haliangium ochraceum (strain DSM 14365 / JCM 11303 / SMP-2) TaxID=502025 RepID=D0LXS7_HALO1|nr:RNA polymerase sigma factor [Haliangium ochraceum]ACY14282.1 RNA polymerase, sigma-24 subunit, ECF subfamily [Haliangium ochraceum DSM 14365]
MERSDAELLETWRTGDAAAGEVLFDRYYDSIERFFLNKVSTNVGDLVQETFLACVEGRDRVQNSAKFRSYLFSIAYNVLRGHLRGNYRRGHALELDEVTMEQLMPGAGTLLGERREQRLLLEALRNIPLPYQVILELHYWEQMSTENISEVLGRPVGTVRSRMRRARELLEEIMSRLAHSRDELKSTVTRLDDWAAQCRRDMLALSS